MTLEKAKKFVKEYGLTTILGIGFISTFTTLGLNAKDVRNLENSNYVVSYTAESTSRLYGYDNNQDGNLDRIEEVGIIPFKTGMPAFRIRRTHLSTDQNFSWYNQRIKILGR